MQRAPADFAIKLLQRRRRFSVWFYLTNAHMTYAFSQELLPEPIVAGPIIIKADGTGKADGTYIAGGDVPGPGFRYAVLADPGAYSETLPVSAALSQYGASQEIDSLTITLKNTKDGDGYHLVSRILANENLLSARAEARAWFPGDGTGAIYRLKRYVVDAYEITRRQCRLSLIGA